MKYLFFIKGFLFVFLLTQAVFAQSAKIVVKKASAADIAMGKHLISKSDCAACHKIDVKLLGPSYQDIAKKYPATEANYNALAQKIIKGGSGVWGQIPMAPHANLSVADSKKMIQYILSLKVAVK